MFLTRMAFQDYRPFVLFESRCSFLIAKITIFTFSFIIPTFFSNNTLHFISFAKQFIPNKNVQNSLHHPYYDASLL